jgi:hypothetical protein
MNDLTPPAPDNLPALPLVSDTMIDAAFDDAVGSAALVSFVREGVFAEAIDASTTEGLERIRSRAHQIRGAKAKFEKRGKELSTQAALVPKRINQLREALKHRMEVLVEDFRKPLTDHEAAENIRKEAHEKAINEIATSPLLTVRSPVARIKERIAELNEIDLSARWEEFHGDATMAVAVRLEALNAMLADAKLMADAEKLLKERAQRDKEMADLRAKLAAAEAAVAARVAEAEAKAAAEVAEAARVAEVAEAARVAEVAEVAEAARVAEVAEAARVAEAEAVEWLVSTPAEEAAEKADTAFLNAQDDEADAALASKMEALVMGVAAFVEDADNAASEATKAQDKLLGKPPICFTYTNWRGETRLRRAIPYFVWHRATEHHPEPQWIMCAWDLEKMEQRSFALANCDFTNLTDGMPA